MEWGGAGRGGEGRGARDGSSGTSTECLPFLRLVRAYSEFPVPLDPVSVAGVEGADGFKSP